MFFVVVRHRKSSRSGCPVSGALEAVGDRWSLLIVRDMMVRGFTTFKQFEMSGENIATNILADRLAKLRRAGIIHSRRDERDARAIHYRLTEKGIDLAPLVFELLLWGGRYGKSGKSCAAIAQMEFKREAILNEVRRRWREHDARPLQVSGRWMLEEMERQAR